MPGCPHLGPASVYLVCIFGQLFHEAFALKLPKNTLELPDHTEAVEREIAEGDQRGANTALLAAAEGGKDPEDLQKWLSTASPLSNFSAEGYDRSLGEDVWNLLETIRANRPDGPEAVKALILNVARTGGAQGGAGGAHRVSKALQALQALGYSPQELQSWIERRTHGQALVAKGPARAIENSWNVYLLIDGLKHSSRAEVKKVLAHIGAEEMVHVLGMFAALGYDYKMLLKWLQSEEEEEVEIPSNSDFALLLKDLEKEAETRAEVKEVFARMLKTGNLSSSFARLQSMGYDLDALKRWYQSRLKAPPQPAHQRDSRPGKLGEIFRNDSLTPTTLKAPKGLFHETLQHLHSLGSAKRQEKASKAKRAAEGAVEVATAATAERAGTVEVPLKSSHSAHSRLDAAAKGFYELLGQVQRAHKAEVLRLLSSEFRSGGQLRVQQAFAYLEAAGYNHKDVQAWLTGGPAPPLQM
ncbi:hypothetical protein AK812_SmicGene32403 [Symbiodinium microadriaticum]|uniref:Uncharacterized protein n=1 Tax=Symbiodinium microadriaticum TaxID=2951 RepID=A0A1Q9CU91_SYMMI|nr:hypothetical protein AK812_SmicGene32403 [Symbiodinium microadriaticum]